MSTKNLARTVIEGGRSHRNRWDRRHSNARVRAGERDVSRHLLVVGDFDGVVYPRREVVYHGILRRVVQKRLRHRWRWHLPEPRSVLEDWLAGRRIGERGERTYWFVPTESGAFRQHHALSEADAVRWHSLPAWFREQFDAFSARPTPPIA